MPFSSKNPIFCAGRGIPFETKPDCKVEAELVGNISASELSTLLFNRRLRLVYLTRRLR